MEPKSKTIFRGKIIDTRIGVGYRDLSNEN